MDELDVQKDLIEILVELLGNICKFIDVWFEFYSCKGAAYKTFDEDFWSLFIEKAIGKAIKEDFRKQIVQKCLESNPYLLFTVCNTASEIAQGISLKRNLKNTQVHRLFKKQIERIVIVYKEDNKEAQNLRC